MTTTKTPTQAEKKAFAVEAFGRHNPNFIPAIREVRERFDCGLKEAKELVDFARGPIPSCVDTVPVVEDNVQPQPNWNAKSAERWLRRYALHLSREARYIRENTAGFAENEDEFRCGLANDLGIDDVAEQDEIVAEVHAATRQTKDNPADKPSRKSTKSVPTP